MDDRGRPLPFFTTTYDAVVIWLLNLIVLGVVVANVSLWLKRGHLIVRAKTLPLVTLQTAAGVLWYIGFTVRNGHIVRPAGTVWAQCNFWWFWVSMVFGMGLWCSCILVRLIRLQTVFVSGKSFDVPWPLLLFVVDLPMVLYYGFFLPLMGAVDHHPLLHSCIYNSTLWIIADFAAALWYMLAMLVLLYILRDVKDDLGENESVRRALLFSFGLWTITLAVQVFGWDHLWYGRCIKTAVVVAAIVAFFFLQNEEVFNKRKGELRLNKLAEAFQLAFPDEEGQQSSQAVDMEEMPPAESAGSPTEGSAGSAVSGAAGSSTFKSVLAGIPVAAYASGSKAAVNTRVRQRMFSRAVLGNNPDTTTL